MNNKMAMDTENKIVFQKTILENHKELNSIKAKQKLFLFLFYSYFMKKYKVLMSELSHE